jgi:hypothetical protein
MSIKQTLTLVASQCWMEKERSSGDEGGFYVVNVCQAVCSFSATGA